MYWRDIKDNPPLYNLVLVTNMEMLAFSRLFEHGWQHIDVQPFKPTHWARLDLPDEVKSFGCQAFVLIPTNDGRIPKQAFIRLNHSEYERVGATSLFVPASEME